jgi:protein transport protein SEC24
MSNGYPTNNPPTRPPPPNPFPHNTGNGYGQPSPSAYPEPQQPQQKINPSQLPHISIPTIPHEPLQPYYPKATLMGQSDPVQPPPPANSRFIVLDDGNASPLLIRSAMSAIPYDRSTLQQVLGDQQDKIELLCTPMAVPSSPVPIFQTQPPLAEEIRLTQVAVDGTTDKTKPPRCDYCHAYANSFWDASKCNFCNRLNRSSSGVPPLASMLGTVEYPVAGPYVTRPPVQPVFLYALDATAPSCQKYVQLLMEHVFPQLTEHAQQQQQHVKSPPSARVGIVFCVASGVYIPTWGEGDGTGTGTGFVVMPDVQHDPFSPLPLQKWTFDIVNEYDKLNAMCARLLQDLLPKLIKERVRVHDTIGNSRDQPVYQLSCGGAAMAFLVDALKETGGRAVWITWRRPNCGIGILRDRERSKTVKPTYKPLEDNFYTCLTQKCQDHKIAMDIVLHTNPAVPKAFLDVATLGQVCAGSNGNLIRITSPTWHECFTKELVKRVTCSSGWDCVFKVRCSTGLRVNCFLNDGFGKSVGSNSLTSSSPDLELSVAQADTCIGVQLEHRVGGIPKEDPFVYVQTALLYTNAWTGDRRMRVSTLGLRTCQTPDSCFPSMDFGTIVALELRRAAASIVQPDQDLTSTRNMVFDRCLAILTAYRKRTRNDQMIGQSQLVMPEKLRLLPAFVLSLFKSPLLRNSVDRRSQLPNPLADDRSYYIQQASRITPAMAFLMVHPLLFCIPDDDESLAWKTFASSDGTLLSQLRHSPYVELPDAKSPTIATLDDDQVYLMDTCFALYVLIEKQVSQERIKTLDPENGALGRAIGQLRNFSQVGNASNGCMRPTHPPIIFVNAQQDKTLYDSLLKWMVADATPSEKDLMDFYVHLHRKVQNQP